MPALEGTSIGGYNIHHRIPDTEWGPTYHATQVALQRPVFLTLLDPTAAASPARRDAFLEEARNRAQSHHPSVLTVYETGEQSGWYFFASERVEGRPMNMLALAGVKLSAPQAAEIGKHIASGLAHLNHLGTPHAGLRINEITIGSDNLPRISNRTIPGGDQQALNKINLATIGAALLPILSPAAPTEFVALLSRTQPGHKVPIHSIEEFIDGCGKFQTQAIFQNVAAGTPLANFHSLDEIAKKRSPFATFLKAMLLAGLGVGAILLYNRTGFQLDVLLGRKPAVDEVQIPAGTYTLANGKTIDVPAFSIDRHEVTIGEYHQFVKWILENPQDEFKFNHPSTPRGLSNIPENWKIYQPRAERGMPVRGVATSYDSPVVEINWYQAYAYAKWRGRALPSIEQWEIAARGKEGLAYPWGNEWDPAIANTNTDHTPTRPDATGKIDGFNYWGPVKKQRDVSPFGVVGLAGNVSEWVGSITPEGKALLKGANYASAGLTSDQAFKLEAATWAWETVGFRTVAAPADTAQPATQTPEPTPAKPSETKSSDK
jgi:hypothetical protein